MQSQLVVPSSNRQPVCRSDRQNQIDSNKHSFSNLNCHTLTLFFSATFSPDNRPFFVLSVDLGIWYLFKVSIKSKAGWSPESQHWVQMPPGPPTGPPLRVRSLAVSSTEIRVTWQEPDKWERNGPLTGYSVEYNPLNRRGRVVVRNITNPNQTQVLLTGLRMFTEYKIRVRALGLKGPGPLSRHVVEKTSEGGRSCYSASKIPKKLYLKI